MPGTKATRRRIDRWDRNEERRGGKAKLRTGWRRSRGCSRVAWTGKECRKPATPRRSKIGRSRGTVARGGKLEVEPWRMEAREKKFCMHDALRCLYRAWMPSTCPCPIMDAVHHMVAVHASASCVFTRSSHHGQPLHHRQ